MRVLHWYPNLFGGGGVANAVLGLARHQAALGAEVGIAAAAHTGSPLYEPLVADPRVSTIEWQPAWTFRRRGILWRWISGEGRARLRAFHPEVVHIHGELVPDNLQVPRLFECPLVISPHGTFHPAVFVKSRALSKQVYLAIARRVLYRRAAAFHALSPVEAEHIARVFSRGKAYCVPQGPGTTTSLDEGLTSHRPDDAVETCTARFLFVGRLDVYTKGLDLLLDAFATALRCSPARSLSLRMVGPEWRGSLVRLHRRASELGIADRLRFSGALPGRAVAQALRECDIYIQLSRHDSFPLSVVEALLAGKPAILSSAVGPVAYPEVAELPHIRIVPPDAGAAAAAMIDAAHRLDELTASAVEHTGALRGFFSWDRAAATHLEMYSKLCAGSRPCSHSEAVSDPGWAPAGRTATGGPASSKGSTTQETITCGR